MSLLHIQVGFNLKIAVELFCGCLQAVLPLAIAAHGLLDGAQDACGAGFVVVDVAVADKPCAAI